MPFLFWVIVGVVSVLLVIGTTAIPLAKRWRRNEAVRAEKAFRQQREVLEARFLDMAKSLGKPRGLRWLNVDWLDAVKFARDRQTGLLTAFAGINIHFEAVEGGDMEDVAAVDTVRDAVAVFHFHNGMWGTGGKALFNMNTNDVIHRLVAQFEPVTEASR